MEQPGTPSFPDFLWLLKLQLAKASAKVYAQVWLSRAKTNHYSRKYEFRAINPFCILFSIHCKHERQLQHRTPRDRGEPGTESQRER